MSPKSQIPSARHASKTSILSARSIIGIIASLTLSFITYSFLSHTVCTDSDMLRSHNALLDPSRHEYPGDKILPNAVMVYDQTIFIPAATPAEIFPWLLQLGAQRAGWYLPFWLEALVPERMRASHGLNPRWTDLTIGQQVPDFQLPFFDKEVPTFELIELSGSTLKTDIDAAAADEELYAVWRSERYGCEFTWTQMTRRAGTAASSDRSESWSDGLQRADSTDGSVVHLRFRGVIQAQALKRALLVWGGEKMDWASTQPMLAGLRDRVLMAKKRR